MITNNLQENIEPKPNDDFEYVDFDHHDTFDYKKDKLSNSKSESMATKVITIETSLVPIKIPEIPDSNYQPESEHALIDYVMSQNNRLEVATIFIKWEIGRSINSFYKGKYGARELEKISKETGIGRDNLNKMIKFAEQYNQEQLKALIKGNFALSWNGIAQNLAIKPEKLIEVYEKAGSISEFHKDIMNCKDPGEMRGKVKPSKIKATQAIDTEQPEQSHVASTEITVAIIPEKDAENSVITVPEIISEELIPAENHDDQKGSNDKITQEYSKEFESLRIENQRLREEVAEKNRQIDSLNSMMKEDERDIKDKDLLLAVYRDRFKRLRFMIDNNFSIGNIMELLAAVE